MFYGPVPVNNKLPGKYLTLIITISGMWSSKLWINLLITDVFTKIGDRAHHAGSNQADGSAEEYNHYRFND